MGAAAGISAGDFWQQLLAGHHAELQAVATASLGKGKRQRRKLVGHQDQEALLDSYLREAGGSGDSDRGRRSRESNSEDDADYEVGPEEKQEQRADEEQDVADWGLVPEERQQWHQLQQQRKQAWQEQEQQQRRQPGKPAKRPLGRLRRPLQGGLDQRAFGVRTVSSHAEAPSLLPNGENDDPFMVLYCRQHCPEHSRERHWRGAACPAGRLASGAGLRRGAACLGLLVPPGLHQCCAQCVYAVP